MNSYSKTLKTIMLPTDRIEIQWPICVHTVGAVIKYPLPAAKLANESNVQIFLKSACICCSRISYDMNLSRSC